MKYLCFITLLLLSRVSIANEVELFIPSDPKAKYFIIDKTSRGSESILVTKRIGSSGVSFSKRLFNCKNKTVKYLGFGDSISEMNSSKPDVSMSPIVEGSIADYQRIAACK